MASSHAEGSNSILSHSRAIINFSYFSMLKLLTGELRRRNRAFVWNVPIPN